MSGTIPCPKEYCETLKKIKQNPQSRTYRKVKETTINEKITQISVKLQL